MLPDKTEAELRKVKPLNILAAAKAKMKQTKNMHTHLYKIMQRLKTKKYCDKDIYL